MKHLIISAFVALSFAACTTKETKTTETVETVPTAPAPETIQKTVVIHDQAPPATPPPAKVEKQNRVEFNITDSGSGIKIKLP